MNVDEASVRTNGSGAAAILAAGVGSFVFALLALAGDKSAAVKSSLVFYKPTGALSGVSDVAILIWIVVWVGLELMWRRKTVRLGAVCGWSFAMLVLGFLLTFPPVVDLL